MAWHRIGDMHYLNKCWPDWLTQIYGISGRCVKSNLANEYLHYLLHVDHITYLFLTIVAGLANLNLQKGCFSFKWFGEDYFYRNYGIMHKIIVFAIIHSFDICLTQVLLSCRNQLVRHGYWSSDDRGWRRAAAWDLHQCSPGWFRVGASWAGPQGPGLGPREGEGTEIPGHHRRDGNDRHDRYAKLH